MGLIQCYDGCKKMGLVDQAEKLSTLIDKIIGKMIKDFKKSQKDKESTDEETETTAATPA